MNAKTKLQAMGFGAGHVQLLTVAVALFAVLMYAQSSMSITTLFASADDEVKMITYEDALAESNAQYGNLADSSVSQAEEEQLALLDRNQIDGKVLGEAIGIGEIPDADQLLLPEIDAQLKVNATAAESEVLRDQYVRWSQNIERDGNITALLAALNSTDKNLLRDSANGWNWVVTKMGNVVVPPSMQKLHKSKMVYYSVLMNITKIYAGEKSEADMPLLTKAMLSYSEKVESLRQEVNQQYSLEL